MKFELSLWHVLGIGAVAGAVGVLLLQWTRDRLKQKAPATMQGLEDLARVQVLRKIDEYLPERRALPRPVEPTPDLGDEDEDGEPTLEGGF